MNEELKMEFRRVDPVLEALRIYAPFLVALTLVVGLTYIRAVLTSNGDMVLLHELMNSFMGFFFIVFAVPKFYNLTAFAAAFKRYDLIAQHYPTYGKLYPFIELLLGGLFLSSFASATRLGMITSNVLVTVVSGLGLASVIVSKRRKQSAKCACLGTAFSMPLSKISMTENGVMMIMALGMLLFSSSLHLTVVSLGHLL